MSDMAIFITENWSTILTVLTGAVGIIGALRTKSLSEWLKQAVIEAEKEMGTGTGELKLQLVYNAAIKQYPVLATIMPFALFKKLVDLALDWMREKMESNSNIKSYIEG